MYVSWQIRSLLLTALWIVAALASTVWAEEPALTSELETCTPSIEPCTQVKD
ncbi:MAG: hypothetical protein AAFX07_08460 [Pseudomonadota bacterium]